MAATAPGAICLTAGSSCPECHVSPLIQSLSSSIQSLPPFLTAQYAPDADPGSQAAVDLAVAGEVLASPGACTVRVRECVCLRARVCECERVLCVWYVRESVCVFACVHARVRTCRQRPRWAPIARVSSRTTWPSSSLSCGPTSPAPTAHPTSTTLHHHQHLPELLMSMEAWS